MNQRHLDLKMTERARRVAEQELSEARKELKAERRVNREAVGAAEAQGAEVRRLTREVEEAVGGATSHAERAHQELSKERQEAEALQGQEPLSSMAPAPADPRAGAVSAEPRLDYHPAHRSPPRRQQPRFNDVCRDFMNGKFQCINEIVASPPSTRCTRLTD